MSMEDKKKFFEAVDNAFRIVLRRNNNLYITLYRSAYYVPLQESLGLTHTQIAAAASAYGITAMISYFRVVGC